MRTKQLRKVRCGFKILNPYDRCPVLLWWVENAQAEYVGVEYLQPPSFMTYKPFTFDLSPII